MKLEIDSDGYPTQESLERLRALGSPEEALAAVAEYLEWYRPGSGYFDGGGVYRFATSGWSGCEDAVAALPPIVEALCWQESHRGGLHIYALPGTRYQSELEVIRADCARKDAALREELDFILKICYEDGFTTEEIEGWQEIKNLRAALAPAAPEPEMHRVRLRGCADHYAWVRSDNPYWLQDGAHSLDELKQYGVLGAYDMPRAEPAEEQDGEE